VKSFGCENNTAHESPIQSWNLIGPSVVSFKFFGTPEQAAETLIALRPAGVDAVQFEFWRYAEEIEYFAERVLPLLEQAGLREFEPEATQHTD
jgi:alkanesulfonate monooxygenase SsuD/methylene tetrahydromethanopterin reductase-like flavin-dependent oxidoreductase (luciferase family)